MYEVLPGESSSSENKPGEDNFQRGVVYIYRKDGLPLRHFSSEVTRL
jgi:hypothetical protein